MEKGNIQLRTYARIAGIAGIVIYLIYLVVKVFPELLDTENPNTTADTSILFFLILGYIFAWHKEYEGGIMLMFITIIAGMSYFYQNSTPLLSLLLAVCIPLFISGLLFTVYHYLKVKQMKSKD